MSAGDEARVEEPFVLNAMVSLVLASGLIFWRRDLLLQYFYFNQLLALTHLLTLGFLSSLMMGVLYRVGPTFVGVTHASRLVARLQFIFFFIGSWGMIVHFWLGESRGMSWSTFLLFGAGSLQVWNFRALFRPSGKNPWTRRFLATSVVYFLLAAIMGILLGLVKGYDVRAPILALEYIDNVFAHAHLAAVGWVLTMICGVELAVVPTTTGNPRFLPFRYALLQVGTLGIAFAFLTGRSVAPFAIAILVFCVWHAWGPARALLVGRAHEWELLPLTLLVLAASAGVALSLGWPAVADPARGRLQLAYGFLGIVGFMVATVVSVAFKLFPMWVWKERFEADFGKRPVPGMKELHSETLRIVSNAAIFAGALGTATAIVTARETLLTGSTALLLVGVVCFVANFVRVARWGLLNLTFEPTKADEDKFKEIFR